jgi:GNAT superfamily N-acetyltransferase
MSDESANFEAARPATSDDVERLVDIAREHSISLSGQRGADLLLRRELAFDRDQLTNELRRAVSAPDSLLVVGTIDGVVFGFGLVHFETLPDGALLARLDQLVVESEAREVGIGEAMMNLIIGEATSRGCLGIDSRALPGDRETKNFFESFGLKARQLVVHLNLNGDEVVSGTGPTEGT